MAADDDRTEARGRKVLLQADVKLTTPSAELMHRVSRAEGVGAIRQLLEFLSLKGGRGKLDIVTYYSCRVYDPRLKRSEKQRFIGISGNKALNQQFGNTPEKVSGLDNKFLVSHHLATQGVPTATTQALFYPGKVTANTEKHLSTRDEIVNFLKTEARYPIFMKPNSGTRSGGSALGVANGEKSDDVLLHNGEFVSIERLADEIVSDYQSGFLFQDAIRQAPRVSDLVGSTVSSVRIVTAKRNGEIKPLYALWKLAAPMAASDNFWQNDSMLAQIDLSSGKVRSVCRGTGPDRTELATHPETGKSLRNVDVSLFHDACQLAVLAHGSLGEIGIVGFDIALAEGGPIIIEANTNPFNILYQIASGRGFLEIVDTTQ